MLRRSSAVIRQPSPHSGAQVGLASNCRVGATTRVPGCRKHRYAGLSVPTIECPVFTSSPDHRQHRRVEFFRVPVLQEHVPVWVFKPADAAHASAGLVMNLGEGGLQVLTASDDPPHRPAYEIQLLLGEDEAVTRFGGRVTRMWTREATTAGWLCGLRFDDVRSPAEAFLRAYQAEDDARRWVRCLLLPP